MSYNSEFLELQAAALVVLTEAGIPSDTQELLLWGRPERGIPPGALSRLIRFILSTKDT